MVCRTTELTSRDHSATSVFMSSKRLFQGPGLPPSNAVYAHPQPGAPPLPPQYHQARKGCTTFFFNFPLPLSCPNSITFGNGLARIFYEIRATVAVFWKGERTVVCHNKEVQVTECLIESRIPREPSTLVAEGGKMVVRAQVVGGIGVSGRSTCVELQVKNHSQKKVRFEIPGGRSKFDRKADYRPHVDFAQDAASSQFWNFEERVSNNRHDRHSTVSRKRVYHQPRCRRRRQLGI